MHTTTTSAAPAARVCETIEQVRALQEPSPADAPYAPDWTVHRIVDKGVRERYRWYVVGINDNCAAGEYGRVFYWHVPELSWRYVLTNAVLVKTELEACSIRLE